MNNNSPTAVALPIPSTSRTLRKLFLTLFLRGRSARNLQANKAPGSISSKLGLALLFYFAFGCLSFSFIHQSLLALSIYLHGMTLVFVGMFVASSTGEVLFNVHESEILLHRPVTPRELLWAKVTVLIQVSIWLAGAFNLAGLLAGTFVGDGGWTYIPAHAASTILQALFCTGFVVLGYQICLRMFGRERLNNVMTTVQVIVAIAAVMGGQIAPQVLGHADKIQLTVSSWWITLLPPAWFAGLDDAIAGSHALSSTILGLVAIVATATVVYLAFIKLAQDYETSLQLLGESSSPRNVTRTGRRLSWFIDKTPLRWWLRDSVSRASFLLTTAYLLRDRETKLRIYPGLAPMLAVPIILIFNGSHAGRASMGGFGAAFCGMYVGIIPLLALGMLKYSQQWQAADLFRYAPMVGPKPICDGTRRAVLCILTVPMVIMFATIIWLLGHDTSQLLLLLPGMIAIPVYALIPCMGGEAVPFSQPAEEAKSANRGLNMIFVMLISFALAGLAQFAMTGGWFKMFLAIETIICIVIYIVMRIMLKNTRWTSAE